MACPQGTIQGCDFIQALVDQTPYFDQMIMEDIRPTDGWIGNFATATAPMGTPTEIVQDRFRVVWPNTTKTWRKVVANGPGCTGNPCDPPKSQIGWGADRLVYFAEEQTWETPLQCYNQAMHITHAVEHVEQIVTRILKPATSAIHSNYLRKRTLQWGKRKIVANQTMDAFTFQWTLGGPNGDEEIYFDCSVSPSNVYKLSPQHLQFWFSPLMREGYAGYNPFKETAPYIELVTDMNTCWELDKLGGATGFGGVPSVTGNWRFTEWGAANAYWRYGFSGQVGNYMVRVDEMGLRFNFVGDLGAGANGGNGNRYRYQIVLPYENGITTGAGGAAGLGADVNLAFDRAQYCISFISHKKGLELLVPEFKPLNAEMPFLQQDFGGKWRFAMHDLGADSNGVPINNEFGNKGKFVAWFQNYVRPMHYEFLISWFHKREPMCIPNIGTCNPDPGYPVQYYDSALPPCPLPAAFIPPASIPADGVLPQDTFTGLTPNA